MKHKEFKVINKGEIDRIEKEVQALLDEDCGWQVLTFGEEHVGAAGFYAAMVRIVE